MFESISISLLTLIAQAAQPVAVPWYKTGLASFVFLAMAVALGILLARAITGGSQFADFRRRTAITLVTLLVCSLMVWSKWPPKFGVDLRGGINMVGSLNLEQWVESDAIGASKPTAASIIPELIRRVNPAGVKEIMIRPLGTDKIEVTIPSADLAEANSIWDRLTKAGKLEFRILADAQYPVHAQALALATQQAKAGSRAREVVDTDSEGNKKTIAYWTTLAREVVAGAKPDQIIPIKFVPQRGHLVRDKTTGQILAFDQIAESFGGNLERHGYDFAKWCKEKNIRNPQILVMKPDERMNVEGKHLYKVSNEMDERGRACVGFVTTDEGTFRMGAFTKQNVEKLMGTVLDDQLHSAATVQEAIYKNGRITGSFTPQEVEEMVINLKSGKLDVALNKTPISQNFINSTLGEDLKAKGIWAIGASLILVMAFMIFYYRSLGVLACFCLLLNGLLALALVMAIDQPLTLTGLAGFVLTIGMAVDANVLIYERMREELNRGAAIRMAIRNGFDKAMTTIIDSNLTTIVTALALYVIGTEQLKGFAVTLILGILCSMFASIYIGRLILEFAERKRWFTQANMVHWLENKVWDFMSAFRTFGSISLVTIIAGMIALYALGDRILDQDLRGGSTARVVFNQPISIEDVRSRLSELDIKSPNGEKIDFNVSSFGGPATEGAKDLEYKIDSNLQAWEGQGEKFEQLTEILDRVFKGQLKKNSFEVVGGENSGGANPGTSSNLRIRGNREQPAWRSASSLAGFSVAGITGGMLVQQDQAKTNEPSETSSAPAAAAGEQAPAANQSTDAQGAAEEGLRSEPLPTDPVLPGETGTQDPAGTVGGGDFQPTPIQEIDVKTVSVVRKLKFGEKISGKGVQELLIRASQAAQLGIDEDQIELDSPDIPTDQSPLGTESKDWKVTLKVNQEADADTIISTWKSEFNQQTYFPANSKVGSQIADSARWQALGAIFASLIGIIIYVWVRFQNIAFGLSAVVALVHDVLAVLAALAFSHWLAGALGVVGVVPFKISLEIVAAILTVIGYSLNDTIVIFDRIREVRGKQTKITKEMLNTSISQTLSRTIITSLTTFMVVFVLYCFGGEAIHGFAFALCVGVVVGTYSTIFIACPTLLWLMNTVGLNPGEVDSSAPEAT
jgi:SecD/SecF fusion protein